MDTDEQEDTYEPIVQARDREAAEKPIHCMPSSCRKSCPNEKLRSRSIREVKQPNGEISFKDDLIFQKSL